MSNEEYIEIMDNSNFLIDSTNPYDMQIKETLEKQIPKKVIFVHPLQEDDDGDYMCPTCESGTVYDAYGNKPPYCHYCGQALDWQ